MNVGHSSPNSNDSTVPLTAPTANSTANALHHRRAISYQTRSPVRMKRSSMNRSSHGRPMPKTANTMWKPSENAICSRAAVRLSSTSRSQLLRHVELLHDVEYMRGTVGRTGTSGDERAVGGATAVDRQGDRH